MSLLHPTSPRKLSFPLFPSCAKVKKLGKSSSGFPQFISLKTVHGTYIKAEPLEAEGKVWAHLGGPRIGPWEKFQVVPRGEEEWGEE